MDAVNVIDFIGAAAPWIMMGIVLTLFAARHEISREKDYMAQGLVLGMGVGALLSLFHIFPTVLCISGGMLLGTLIGMTRKK